MANYDEENLLDDIVRILRANLNTKITQINNEKADSITLDSVHTNAYMMDMDDSEANYDPLVLYDITELDSEGNGPATLRQITVNVAIILNENGQDLTPVRKMLRYGRALREVIEEHFYKINQCESVLIESLPVLSFQKSNESVRYKIVGINIKTTIC